jgi:hypothetical protein
VVASAELVALLDSGHLFVGEASPHDVNGITAVVPLKIGESMIGAIVVFRLLEHKQGLQSVDHELFELLAVHASTALYCANLHEVNTAAAAL